MEPLEIAYSAGCVVVLSVILARSWRLGFVTLVLLVALWVPAMSHIYHLLFGEGSLADGDPWYDSYEIAVFAEVVILRAISTVLLRSTSAALPSATGLALATTLPIGFGGRVYDALALGLDAVMLLLYYATL